MTKQVCIWEIEWRDKPDSDTIYDKQNVIAMKFCCYCGRQLKQKEYVNA